MRVRNLFWVPALAVALAMGGCKAEVEDPGSAPNVDVEGGDLPNVDVDPAKVDVDVSTDTQQVVMPDVDVNTQEPQRP
jgi:hypothetical protein